MVFKSYCWSIGTTSFRVSQLNYKIERQLQLLKEFWNNNPSLKWNEITQRKYYYHLKDNGFLEGEASLPSKDAREKTSGLVDIGVLTKKDRQLTEVGEHIESLLDKERTNNNVFEIDDESYCYLLQFLKLQKHDSGLKIKPFIALIYMLEKLDYLTKDEFTYLLPLCKNKYDVIKTVNQIKDNRKLDLELLIKTKIYDMDNYFRALEEFRKDYPVTEKTFEMIGMNRKSPSYEHAFLPIYNELVNLTFHLRHNTLEERLESYNKLFEYCKNISGNTKSYWISHLFMGRKPKDFDEEFDEQFRKLDVCDVKNIVDFKVAFFERMHIFKWKVTLKDYYDLNRRYFSLTDIIKFGEDRIELELLPKYYFKDIIDDLLNEELLDKKEYLKVFNSMMPIESISPLYSKSIESVVSDINSDLNTSLTIESINTYLQDEKIKQFNKLIDERFKESDIVRLLDQIKAREDSEVCEYVTDNADVPTIFEYLLGIAWYRISNKEGNILKYMNLSLDANLLPKTHAGGGMADIVYEYSEKAYPKHNLLIEATLSESTGQRHMEMEPVSRHLGEDISKTNNENDYVLFVAPDLEERVILDFRNMKTRSYPKANGGYTNGLKIIPINTDILKKFITDHRNYEDLYSFFDRAYRSILPDPEWFDKEILQNV